jgi:hypothetical protein
MFMTPNFLENFDIRNHGKYQNKRYDLMMNGSVIWLQNWFFQNCDGRWEKKERFFLRNIDNPGWGLSLYLESSIYEKKLFDKIIIERTKEDWLHCLLKDNEFISAGGAFNLNEVLHYFRNWVEDRKETTIQESEITNWIQKWYYRNCDGDWEHQNGFSIKTTDNPGWYFEVIFEDTDCEGKTFESVDIKRSEMDWYRCSVKKCKFEAYGGIFNLIDMLNVFREWADKCEKEN